MSLSGFPRLSGALQDAIVTQLGWRELRAVQTLTIDAILEGHNCVVLAPTAGGKTEAAFFPILSRMGSEDWRPISVLYLSPIRALINNQEDRVHAYAQLIGRRAAKWHGDVTASTRKKLLAEPVDILLTTPESLEAMLMSTHVPVRSLFAGLEAVIIDEVHAFAGDARGAHLSAVLERLVRLCGRDVQRVGLSATVGNPEEILRWIAGSSRRAGRVVDPGGARKAPELTLDYVGSIENAAHVIHALHPGKKRLVFTDSRRQAEELGKHLLARDVLTYVMHGSLSVSARRDAERAFEGGEDCVIVATSALELGIDVGDLDHVLQLDSPSTVASFLQRMGRTGRRAGATPNCTFLATKDAGLLHAAAILQLFREGYVEPIHASRRAHHVLAHQLMALSVQHGGVAKSDWWAWLEGSSAFAEINAEERDLLLTHLLGSEILAESGGRYALGPRGEKRFGVANFRKLYAVFDAPRMITVRWATNEVGAVDAQFLSALLDRDGGPKAFVLGGRAWTILDVDWSRGLCAVAPATDGRAPKWNGGASFLSYALCQAMRRVLVAEAPDPAWSRRAAEALQNLRAEHAFLREEDAPLIAEGSKVTWWTFGGGAANLLLAKMLEAELGGKVVSRNTGLTLEGQAASSLVAVRALLARWRETRRPTPNDALRYASAGAEARAGKFAECLPEPLLLEVGTPITAASDARRVLGASAQAT